MNSPIRCIIHCRVSSAKQAQEGESLGIQESICLDIAVRNGWALARAPWLETFSGRMGLRPAFAEILAFLDAHPGMVRYYVFRSIDRFTRGGSYTYEAMKRELAARGVAMVDSYGVIQAPQNTLADVGFEYDWSQFSPSEITETILANAAKSEINSILTRMIGQEIRLTQRGYKIRQPQDGYCNERIHVDGKRRTIQVPDPGRAKFYVTMFELRAAGQLTDAEIVARMNAMGFRTRQFNRWDPAHQRIVGRGGGGQLTVKHFQEIIKRPIYCGVVWEKWTKWLPVQAPYEGLISIETWNAANRGKRFIRRTGDSLELHHDFDPDRVGTILKRSNPMYPFKNVVLCPTCRKPFMGSASRSRTGARVPAYHCARNHPRVARNKAAFEQIVRGYIEGLRFTSRAIEAVIAGAHYKYRERQGEVLDAASAAGRAVADLEADKAMTVRAFKEASSDAMRTALEADAERLDGEIARTAAHRDTLELTEEDLVRYLAEVKKLMSRPSLLVSDPTHPHEQRAHFTMMFEELPTLDELASGTARLSPIFSISEGVTNPQSVLVRLQGLRWNQIEAEVLRWKTRPASPSLA